MNALLSKYFLYYPITMLNGEYLYKYIRPSNEFQWLDKAASDAITKKSLTDLLSFASSNSPYYKQLLGNSSPQELYDNFNKVPFTTKQTLIKNIDSLKTPLAKNASTKTTGGSTGEPVKLYKNADALARERVATWRSYNWAGVNIGDKQARFWGVPHNLKNSIKARLIDFAANRCRVSAFNLTEESLHQYYRQLTKYQPAYLYGYVSVIKTFSDFISAQNLKPIASVKSIITTSEVLTEADRQKIMSAWGVKVFNEYGCGEVGSIAHECEYGNLHVVSDNMLVEIINDNGEACTTGEVVVTDYFNYATPLIRYRLGDFATISNEPCKCGRTLPILKGIHGRAYDIIQTPSGRSIHPEALIYIFEDIQQKNSAFSQFQIIQTQVDQLKIKIIRSKYWTDELKSIIETQIHNKIDPAMKCEFVFCETLEREKSGKMRVVKSEL